MVQDVAQSVKTADRNNLVDQLLGRIAEVLGLQRCELWFGGNGRPTIRENQIVFQFESEFEANRIQRSLQSVLRRAVDQVFGSEFTIQFESIPSTVEFRTQGKSASSRTARVPTSHIKSLPIGELSGSKSPPKISRSRPEFSIDRFWFGSENEMARGAINQTREHVGQFSPLLLYGPTGSGKTHLLEAICSDLRKSRTNMRCVCMTAEQFTNSFVQALRATGLPLFRSKYRDLDVLAIDDIQFFSGKRATITELQYTLDQLSRSGKQVILTSDRPPMELEQIGAELTARIAGGLSCSLRHANESGRLQILKWLCEQRGWNPSDDVLQLIASGITGDARRLMGALNRLWASQLTSGVEPTVEAARKELADLLIANSAGTTLSRIEQVVCEVCGVQPIELKSSTRTKRVSSARMLAMWLSRQHTSSALSEIGDFFGGRSHSTVIAAHKRIDEWMNDDQPIELNSARYPIREAIQLVQRKLRVG